MTYTYDPAQIKARGKDQMRFELGDSFTDGGVETCALADEEYNAFLDGLKAGRKAWMFAKLAIVEIILFKMSYQVNEKIDVLQYDFGDRAKQWEDLYKLLLKQIQATFSLPTIDGKAQRKPPYYYTDVQANIRAYLPHMDNYPFRKMTE